MGIFKRGKRLTGLAAILGLAPIASVAVTCPAPDWVDVGGVCRPVLPSQDYYRSSSDDNYPVCGSGRVPVKRTSTGWTTLDLASSFTPRTSLMADLGPGGTVSYAAPGTHPSYFYQGFTRCMCSYRTYSALPKVAATPSPLPEMMGSGSTVRRFYDDSKQTIESNGTTGITNRYSPVSISKRHGTTVNGRLGTEFQSGNSFCGCPNFNEEVVPVMSSTNEVIGAYCRPRISQHAVLMTYSPTFHDPAGGQSHIMNRSQELDETSEPITQIVLPESPDSAGSLTYVRKIWDCDLSSGLHLNPSTGACEMSYDYHAPGAGTATSPPSEVSPRVRGATKVDQWNNTVNKKFAACLNGFGTTTSMNVTSAPKFDCIANNMVNYASFNALWASADQAADGGLLNAIILANALGQPISGFYTQNGKHCDQYSEFAGPLNYSVVNSKQALFTSTSVGTGATSGSGGTSGSIPLPGSSNGSGSVAYDQLKADVVSKLQKRVPESDDEKRECPLLVRAAAVYSCPEPTGTANMAVYQEVDPADPTRILRAQCPVAKDIKIHMRIEQLTEIKGIPKMPTIDTIVNPSGSSAVSIQRIIAEKYGVSCPSGTVRNPSTGACDPQ